MPRALNVLLPALALGVASPALAGSEPTPVTEQKVSAVDVAATPVTDLNIRKGHIPELLLAAQQQPYAMAGLGSCSAISGEIERLDVLLGDDLDLPQDGKNKTSAGLVTQAAVGSFIPFRGIIREVSGANGHKRRLQAAIMAGIARRSFLKGTGQAKGCDYPARAATAATVAAKSAELASASRPR